MQQELDRFLTVERPNRLMLMTLARRVNVGNFTLPHCKDALLDKVRAHGQQVACLVISGDSVKVFSPTHKLLGSLDEKGRLMKRWSTSTRWAAF